MIIRLISSMGEVCLELVSMIKVQMPEQRQVQRKVARLVLASVYIWFPDIDRTAPCGSGQDWM